MSVKVNVSTKGKIAIILAIAFILGGSGGYLLWRVNQQDTVAPIDSDAGGGNLPSGNDENCSYVSHNPDKCKDGTDNIVLCGDGIYVCKNTRKNANDACSFCDHPAPDPKIKSCRVGSDCSNVCYWPQVAYCESHACKCKSENNGCEDTKPKCTPKCPTGYEKCTTDCGTNVKTVKCSARCTGCDNLYYNKIKCKKTTTTNKCDGGKWVSKPADTYNHCAVVKYSATATDTDGIDQSSIVVKLNGASRKTFTKKENGTSTTISETLSTTTDCLPAGTYKVDITWKDKKGATGTACELTTTFKVEPAIVVNKCDGGEWNKTPSGTYNYCDPITYSATATDTDGIDQSSISVKLNNIARTTFSKIEEGKSTTIFETLSSSTKCLPSGTYKLGITWKDKKGLTGTACALNTTFTVQPETLNPDWSIDKTAVESCVDDGSENPKSRIQYVVTITNTGEGEGSIDKIVDVLDTKVQEQYLENLSDGGTYANGQILWALEGADEVFTAGQSKTYTYTVTIPKEDFGTYQNTVTAYPKTGENIIDAVVIEADCIITNNPDTGIFDSTLSKVVLGAILIVVGINFNQLYTKGFELNSLIKETRKKNFERKVVKK